jgi:hypothetical protein
MCLATIFVAFVAFSTYPPQLLPASSNLLSSLRAQPAGAVQVVGAVAVEDEEAVPLLGKRQPRIDRRSLKNESGYGINASDLGTRAEMAGGPVRGLLGGATGLLAP